MRRAKGFAGTVFDKWMLSSHPWLHAAFVGAIRIKKYA